MASVVIAGGGVVSLCTAMLLADDGHAVTVLERDPAPPVPPAEAWESWERRGVNQFRLPHFFVPRFRMEVERELPRLAKALEEAGALRFNPMELAPASLTGGWRDGDEQFEAITGRRPVFESVVAGCAGETAGVEIRRGVAVSGLVFAEHESGAVSRGPGSSSANGVPHVTGVRTESEGSIAADLVVDATGRRSQLPVWLEAGGAKRPVDELEDSGFVYYGRHFGSADGAVPPIFGPLAQSYGSIDALTLPADNGTWSVVIVAGSKDRELRALRQTDRWEAVVRSLPLVAHWLEGDPFEEGIVTMSKIEDRRRRMVVDGRPVATGVVALADAWACSNPSLGRGVSIGLLHGLSLRELLRAGDLSDPRSLASEWDERTSTGADLWYEATLRYDRHRLAEIDAEIEGREWPEEETTALFHSLEHAAGRDPDCMRAMLQVVGVLRTPQEIFADPQMMKKVTVLGAGWADAERMGPSRSELLSLVSS